MLPPKLLDWTLVAAAAVLAFVIAAGMTKTLDLTRDDAATRQAHPAPAWESSIRP